VSATVRVRNVSKSFGRTRALSGVSLVRVLLGLPLILTAWLVLGRLLTWTTHAVLVLRVSSADPARR